ncbi:uncharacterized protein ACA1_354330 [Acanthamoeba castellanii str. Neff]|uniref:Uncharacterized protein n=1 Tax=Acanthamoeba castellanii (strain ATCC 30010 / Neff) TaxID=1257118 RepID=L8GCU7_ACACF|nr:uncharacterized protein ACA1_354330 [Acanthamoeba castellanii str. Neff]ELR10995.1 hypothetical protein ACA1_354330 [Acanthamoeba castellanii str. Neff]
MEGKAFQQMLNWMEKKGLLLYFKVFCCNQDSSVLHQLNTDPQTAHVQVVHNPGHTKKNFVKDLKKAFGGDIPKSIFFSSTYVMHMWLLVIRGNLGSPGAAYTALWHALGFTISLLNQAQFNLMDKHLHNDHIYSTYKKRETEVRRTIDYIWYPADAMVPVALLAVPAVSDLPDRLPCRNHPSDHLALYAELAWRE